MNRWAKGSIKMNSKQIFVKVWTPATSGIGPKTDCCEYGDEP